MVMKHGKEGEGEGIMDTFLVVCAIIVTVGGIGTLVMMAYSDLKQK